MLMQSAKPLAELENPSEFIARHIGIDDAAQTHMLSVLGAASRRALMEVNETLRADPSLANTDPLGAGWFFKVKMSDVSQLNALMDDTTYSAFSANA